MKHAFLAATGIAFALAAGPLSARAADLTPNLNPEDQSFVAQAAAGGIAEVAFGRKAASDGASPAVRQFGQRMVDDHSRANDQLKTLAAQKKLDVPAEMDQAHKNRLSKLEGKTGAEFDATYLASQVRDHETMIGVFRTEQAQGRDGELKAFATQTIPTLETHLRMAKDLQAGGAVSAGAGSGTGAATGSAAGASSAQ